MYWIELVQDTGTLRHLLHAVMNLPVTSIAVGISCTDEGIISFYKRALLSGEKRNSFVKAGSLLFNDTLLVSTLTLS